MRSVQCTRSLVRSLVSFGNQEPVAEATGYLPSLLRSESQMALDLNQPRMPMVGYRVPHAAQITQRSLIL